jgi:hypothetical protein
MPTCVSAHAVQIFVFFPDAAKVGVKDIKVSMSSSCHLTLCSPPASLPVCQSAHEVGALLDCCVQTLCHVRVGFLSALGDAPGAMRECTCVSCAAACLPAQSIIDTMQTEQVKRGIMVLQSVLTPFAK